VQRVARELGTRSEACVGVGESVHASAEQGASAVARVHGTVWCAPRGEPGALSRARAAKSRFPAIVGSSAEINLEEIQETFC